MNDYGMESLPPLGVAVDDFLLDGELDRIERERARQERNNFTKEACDCPECLIHGKRVRMPERHDCYYTRERSKLVVVAVRMATEKIGNPESGGESKRWMAEFVREMERLSAPLVNGKNGQHNEVKATSAQQNHIQNVELSADPVVTGPEHQRAI